MVWLVDESLPVSTQLGTSPLIERVGERIEKLDA